MDERKNGSRRRGKTLEEAILHAAWEELSSTGYTKMTMESVATRAGTNKSVLYRRWPDKSELVIAAIQKNMPKITDEIPDTGDLRNDIYLYFHSRFEPLKKIGAETIRGLMMEPVVWQNIIASLPQMMERRAESKITTSLLAILKNAERRGEVCLERLSPRIISLPVNLLQNELLTTQGPVSDETLAEIVDDIFMPLVYKSGPVK